MIDTLNDLQNSLPLLLLRGGVLLAISFSVAHFLRRRAQLVRLVWATTALLLLSLPLLQSFQVWHIPAEYLARETIVPAPAPPAELAPAFKTEAIPRYPSPGLSVAVPIDIAMEPQKAPPSIPATAQPTPEKHLPWLLILWLTGVCLGLAYLTLGRLVLWRLRSRRKPATAHWWESLATVGKETGNSVRTRVVFVPEISMPLTVGILSPEIWLPESAHDFDRWHRESVLRHELAHIRGRDALWQLLFSIALATQWMNPLAWMAARSFRLAQERVCDDVALGAEDSAAEEYAFLLLEVARNASHRINFKTIAAPTLMMAKESSLKKRVKLILDKNMKRTSITRPQIWLTMAIVAAIGLPMALVGFGQKSPAAQAQKTGTEPNNGDTALLKRKMKGITIPVIDMNEAPLREAVDFLHEASSDKSGKGIDFVLLKSALSASGKVAGVKDLEQLKKAIRARENTLEAQRQALIALSRSGAHFYRQGNNGDSLALEKDQRLDQMTEVLTQIQGDMLTLRTQIESLSKYDSDQLLIYAAGLDLPENTIKVLYPQYLEIKRNNDGLKANGLGERHPTIVTQNSILQGIRKDLDEGVVNLRTGLQSQLELTEIRFAEVKKERDIAKKDSVVTYIDYIDPKAYDEARNNFETDQKLLEKMKLQLMDAEIGEKSDSGTKANNPHLVSLKLRQVPFEDALKYIALQCGMNYAIHSSAVVIGSPDEIAQLEELNR